MADIENLIAFAENGEKDITGLNQTNGFPAALKPARQWFNYLFNSISVKINEVIERVNNNSTSLEGITDYFLPIGTIISSFDADFNPNIKYPGTTWVLHAQGKVAVGLSTQTFDPEWTKTIGTKFGEFDHQLTTDELPIFSLNYPNQWAGMNPPNIVEIYSHDDIGWAKDGAADTSLLQHTDSVGADQPHNNVQPSIVEARWRRTA
ncbi:phage baseplate protein [Acinetobacter beijerinckii]|uniref:phage baseplate protein n=1 Tax=Acinetobacter beijerinckii TaxID=262668 RepID=UPI0024073026|nr:hypothetical protein [Acinetobacter beijerinckii]